MISGVSITRSYTPVPHKFATKNPLPNYYVSFLVKSYEDGILSQHIVNPLPLARELILSHAKGKSPLQAMKKHNRIAILAAGSGVTPMLSILQNLIDRPANEL